MSKKGIALFLAFLMLFSIFTPQMTTYAATTENIEEVTTSEDTNENDLEQSTEEPENTGQNTEIIRSWIGIDRCKKRPSCRPL